MDEESGQRRGWQRRAIIALAIFFVLLILCHRPLLLFVGRHVALHYAKKEHLQLDLTLEGSIFTNLTVRHVHGVGSPPSEIESIDVDFARIDYNLFDLIRGRQSDFIRNLELRSARIVTKPRPEPSPSPKRKRFTLPAIFPERVRLAGVSILIKDQPHELAVEHLDLELDPHAAGELRVGRIQLPTGQNWWNLRAVTSYTNKNLILRDLNLSDQDRITLVNIDASRILKKQLAVNLEAKIGQGSISNQINLRQVASSVDGDFRFEAKNVAADALNAYGGLPKDFLGGTIENLTIQGHGTADSPRTWTGNATAKATEVRIGGIRFDRCLLQASAQNATATLESLDATEGKNSIHLHGWTTLPEKLSDLGRAPAHLELVSNDIELRELTGGMPQPWEGLAQANGKIEIKNGTLDADFNVAAGPVKFRDGEVEKVYVEITAAKRLTASGDRPWFADLKSKINLNISNLRKGEYVVDSLTGALSSSDEVVQVEQLDLHRKQNSVTVAARYRLPEKFDATSLNGTAQLTVAAPEVGDFWTGDSPDKWSGPFQGEGQVTWTNGIGNGEIRFFSNGLRSRGLGLRQLNAACTIANNKLYLNDFRSDLTDQDFVRAEGNIDLSGQHNYDAKISANLSDLSKLQPLLRSFGNQNNLAGSLVIDWSGRGNTLRFENAGQLKLTLEKAQYGNLKSLHANVDATYSPDRLSIPTIFLQSDQMDFQAIIEAKGETLEITKIQLDQGRSKYASGYISIPFIWKNLSTDSPVIPSSGKIIANFESENIDIKKLFQDFGAKPVASGMLNVKFNAEGTVSQPNARLNLEMRDLRAEQLPKFEPATFHLEARSVDGQLTINGKLEQSKIQPIQLIANLPFDLARIAQDRKLADNTPLQANLKMPRSSVNFVREFVPAVQEVDGDAAIDVDISGTVGQPVFKGQADMTLNVARAIDPTLPALQNFKARLTFVNNVLNLDQFAGELSGGKFSATGRISIPKLTMADVDLAFKANSALIARSDTLAIRTDADIQLRGPINSVNVTGNVALTNSHVLKNLDLIPITLPGRPPPQAKIDHPQLVLPPQFHGWKFDVAVKTKDPVLLRGNLATGGAIVDLRFAGEGSRPGLSGVVRLENVEATLPFSRLDIAYGFLYFNPDDSLNPKIDLHGTSTIQDYIVHVYIYGTALAPEAIFNSEPPLPQEDLISLLSTGTTREQLAGNNNVLAGRAAMLLFQQVYRRVFKKGQAQTSSVFDRFDLDVGTVDPRTGQQQATARFKINNQFMLVGDLGVGGDYKGMVKYLIRFH